MTGTPAQPDRSDAGAGGEYGLIGSTKETRLLRRSIVSRWPVSDATKKKAIDYVDTVLSDKKATYRDCNGAVRCLVAMVQQNQADDHKGTPDQVEHTIRQVFIEDLTQAPDGADEVERAIEQHESVIE